MAYLTCYACHGFQSGSFEIAYYKLESTYTFLWNNCLVEACMNCGCIIRYLERDLDEERRKRYKREEEYLLSNRKKGNWRLIAQLANNSEDLCDKYNSLKYLEKVIKKHLLEDEDMKYYFLERLEATSFLELTDQHFDELIKQGNIPLYRIGKQIRFRFFDLLCYLFNSQTPENGIDEPEPS